MDFIFQQMQRFFEKKLTMWALWDGLLYFQTFLKSVLIEIHKNYRSYFYSRKLNCYSVKPPNIWENRIKMRICVNFWFKVLKKCRDRKPIGLNSSSITLIEKRKVLLHVFSFFCPCYRTRASANRFSRAPLFHHFYPKIDLRSHFDSVF